jgi:hypothetical protein
MKPHPDQLYKKINVLSQEIRKQFLKKGIVIPSQLRDGSIQIGRFSVRKELTGFFTILDTRGDVICDKINLAQTAILVANNLALGKLLDHKILENDRNYGYAMFEEMVQKRSLTKCNDESRACLLTIKLGKSSSKKEIYRKQIINSFEKLRKFI